MRQHTLDEIAQMTAEARQALCFNLDRIAEHFNYKYKTTSNTHFECFLKAITEEEKMQIYYLYIYNKEKEINDLINTIINTLDARAIYNLIKNI